jgi:hypothetical protein
VILKEPVTLLPFSVPHSNQLKSINLQILFLPEHSLPAFFLKGNPLIRRKCPPSPDWLTKKKKAKYVEEGMKESHYICANLSRKNNSYILSGNYFPSYSVKQKDVI